MTKFQILLTDWRQAQELNQTDAAAALNVPIQTYQNWEQGRHAPTAKMLKQIEEQIAALSKLLDADRGITRIKDGNGIEFLAIKTGKNSLKASVPLVRISGRRIDLDQSSARKLIDVFSSHLFSNGFADGFYGLGAPLKLGANKTVLVVAANPADLSEAIKQITDENLDSKNCLSVAVFTKKSRHSQLPLHR
ncbi:MAG: helix-turn-helix transcriptional regulator [Patescibacteria group bacterium]|nr:helix-turn-helix transcriptional regulator [Patescibacteria group bacterium]